jgi:hypothetical protein
VLKFVVMPQCNEESHLPTTTFHFDMNVIQAITSLFVF